MERARDDWKRSEWKKGKKRDDSLGEEEEEEEGEYEVERIEYRIWSSQDQKMLYCIKWKGFPEENNTFEPKENLSEALQAICDEVEERKVMKKVVTHKPASAGRGTRGIKYFVVWDGEEGSGSDGEDIYSQDERDIPEALLDDYWRRAKFLKGAARGKILVKERRDSIRRKRREEYEKEVSDEEESPRKKMKREEERRKEERPKKKKSRLDVDSEVEHLRRALEGESDEPKKEIGLGRKDKDNRSDRRDGERGRKEEEEKKKKKKKRVDDENGREKGRREDEKTFAKEDGIKRKKEYTDTDARTKEKRKNDESTERKREKNEGETGMEKGSKKNVCLECKGKASPFFINWCSEECRWAYLEKLTETILH